MAVEIKTVLYPVKDVEVAKALFNVLTGSEPHVDSPYYVGYSVNGVEVGLVPNGESQGLPGPVPFFDVEDIAGAIVALSALGATVTQEPTDVGGGLLVAKVVDVEGNTIGLKEPPKGR